MPGRRVPAIAPAGTDPGSGWRHAFLLGLLILGATLALPAVAGDTAREQLQRMGDAMRSLSYEGVFVYSQGERTETMQVRHSHVDGQPRERVSALTGKALEVIRQGDHVVCLLPDNDRAIIGYQPRGLLPSVIADELGGVPEQYRFIEGEETRIAGRQAREIRLEPIDGYRYGLRLWIDREHSLLLRSDLTRADGSVLERLLFTELNVVEVVDPQVFEYSLEGIGRIDEVRPLGLDSGERPWFEPAMPAGFSLVGLDTAKVDEAGGDGRQHAIYSDGLASVSLFIDDAADGEGHAGSVDRGALRVRSRRVGGKRVTLVGAVPEATLEYMLRGLEAGTAD